jgi:hypothetical protein
VQLVAALRERQRGRQAQVVVANRVPDVEPRFRAVGPQQLAAAQPGHEHERRGIALARQRPDDARVERAAPAAHADEGGAEHAAGSEAGEERPVRPARARHESRSLPLPI